MSCPINDRRRPARTKDFVVSPRANNYLVELSYLAQFLIRREQDNKTGVCNSEHSPMASELSQSIRSPSPP